MRNAILSPMASQIYNFGNSEAQVPNLDITMPMDSQRLISDRSVHVGGSLYLDQKLFNDFDSQLRDGSFGFLNQSLINYPPVTNYHSTSPTSDYMSQQSIIDPWIEMDFQSRQMRKRTSDEINSQLPNGGVSDLIPNGTEFGVWRKNKRKKDTFSSAELWRYQAKESDNLKKPLVPVRRSQKLSDRITTLQKLVSPYGKTDTAAVLQEAVLYIKLLHEQIKNLLQLPRASSCSYNELEGETPNLRSRGLCLVPVLLTQSLVLGEEFADPKACLGNAILAKDF